MPEKILVLGATGLLGLPVACGLAEKGYQVRVLSRNPERARQKLPEGVEIFRGSAHERADIQKSLAGCDGVHISLPQESELAAARIAADLGKKSGLERITYISATAASRENCWFKLIDVKMRTEEIIRQSGIPFTIFRPTWALDSLGNFVRGNKAMVINGKNPPPIHFFDAKDLGRIVSGSYEDTRSLGKTLYIHGPEGIRLTEALERYISTCHPGASVMRLNLWQARLLSRIVGRLRGVTELIAFYDRVGELGDPSETNTIFEPPSQTLENWLRERNQLDQSPRREKAENQ